MEREKVTKELVLSKILLKKKWILFFTLLLSMFLFSYHLSTLIFDGYPTVRDEQISLILSLSCTLLISIGVYLQWIKLI